jgi:cellulose synthase/poly-beta-1,6-N-acetylglucosamine synthase-like glycosyltransferase
MADVIFTGLAWILLLGYIVTTLEFIIGNRTVQKLAHVPLPNKKTTAALPKVSIIIPARNEQRNIEEALTSILHLNYPNYELVVLNDRSEDQTGDILERMQQRYPQLKVVHIRELPSGWLGKNHAMYVGAQSATGEVLLFTDADIVMEPTALTRAVHYLQTQTLDHLATLPQVDTHHLSLGLFMNTFMVFFALYSRPWQAINPKSKSHIGIGAFNLIRKCAYEAIGTHQAIALRPDDDMKLGKLVKKYGFRQAAANGRGMIRVEWYASLGELIDGLSKNAFAGLNYNLPYMVFGVTAQFLFNIWPLLAVFISQGGTQMIYLMIVVMQQLLYFDNARHHHLNRWSGLFSPFCTALLMYIIIRATYLNLRHDGIYWRGTHYPLAELKANRV